MIHRTVDDSSCRFICSKVAHNRERRQKTPASSPKGSEDSPKSSQWTGWSVGQTGTGKNNHVELMINNNRLFIWFCYILFIYGLLMIIEQWLIYNGQMKAITKKLKTLTIQRILSPECDTNASGVMYSLGRLWSYRAGAPRNHGDLAPNCSMALGAEILFDSCSTGHVPNRRPFKAGKQWLVPKRLITSKTCVMLTSQTLAFYPR